MNEVFIATWKIVSYFINIYLPVKDRLSRSAIKGHW